MDRLPLDNDLFKIIIVVRDIFNNKEKLKTKISMLCIDENKKFKVKRSTIRDMRLRVWRTHVHGNFVQQRQKVQIYLL